MNATVSAPVEYYIKNWCVSTLVSIVQCASSESSSMVDSIIPEVLYLLLPLRLNLTRYRCCQAIQDSLLVGTAQAQTAHYNFKLCEWVTYSPIETLDHWIVSFDIPSNLQVDNGKQFVTKFFASVCSYLGIRILTTT